MQNNQIEGNALSGLSRSSPVTPKHHNGYTWMCHHRIHASWILSMARCGAIFEPHVIETAQKYNRKTDPLGLTAFQSCVKFKVEPQSAMDMYLRNIEGMKQNEPD